MGFTLNGFGFGFTDGTHDYRLGWSPDEAEAPQAHRQLTAVKLAEILRSARIQVWQDSGEDYYDIEQAWPNSPERIAAVKAYVAELATTLEGEQ